jgi:hypothetical protein
MTEEEWKRSRKVRDMIRVIDGVSAEADLLDSIAHMEAVARAGDRAAVIAAIRGVVPEFVPDPTSEPESVTARPAPVERSAEGTAPAATLRPAGAGLTSG